MKKKTKQPFPFKKPERKPKRPDPISQAQQSLEAAKKLDCPGKKVLVTMDDGQIVTSAVTQVPWKLDCGLWVVGLEGFPGGFSTIRVKPLQDVPSQIDDSIGHLLATKKWCYTIPMAQNVKKQGGYIPSIAVAGVSGHFPLSGHGIHSAPWIWGPSLEEAEAICDQYNHNLGLSKEEAWRLVASTLNLNNEKD